MKIIKKINFRIVIEPATYHVQDEKYIESTCKQIVDNVKRHVDDVSSVGYKFDTEVTCSFCGLYWETDKETGEPVCCTKAINEFNLTNPLKK